MGRVAVDDARGAVVLLTDEGDPLLAVDEPGVRAVDELVERVVDELVERVVDELVDRVVDELVDRVVDELVDRVADELVDRVVDELAEGLVVPLALAISRARRAAALSVVGAEVALDAPASAADQEDLGVVSEEPDAASANASLQDLAAEVAPPTDVKKASGAIYLALISRPSVRAGQFAKARLPTEESS